MRRPSRARRRPEAPQRHLACFVVDHIVADGISVGLLFVEMQALYREHIGGPPAAL